MFSSVYGLCCPIIPYVKTGLKNVVPLTKIGIFCFYDSFKEYSKQSTFIANYSELVNNWKYISQYRRQPSALANKISSQFHNVKTIHSLGRIFYVVNEILYAKNLSGLRYASAVLFGVSGVSDWIKYFKDVKRTGQPSQQEIDASNKMRAIRNWSIMVGIACNAVDTYLNQKNQTLKIVAVTADILKILAIRFCVDRYEFKSCVLSVTCSIVGIINVGYKSFLHYQN